MPARRKQTMKTFEGYKTVIFFGLVLLVEVANLLGFGSFELTPDQQNIISVVIPLAGLILRYLTKTAIFNKS
jgi:hypothetical protein